MVQQQLLTFASPPLLLCRSSSSPFCVLQNENKVAPLLLKRNRVLLSNTIRPTAQRSPEIFIECSAGSTDSDEGSSCSSSNNTIHSINTSYPPLESTFAEACNADHLLSFLADHPGPVRCVPIHDGSVFIGRRNGPDCAVRLATWAAADVSRILGRPSNHTGTSVSYATIGKHDGVLHVAVDAAAIPDHLTRAIDSATTAERHTPLADSKAVSRPVPLRRAITLLDQEEAELASHGKAIIDWHAATRFCGACGRPMAIVGGRYGGRAKLCTSTDTQACRMSGRRHYPPLDPSIMVLVHRKQGQECLLGRKASWAPRRFSVLSGFCELGEQLEDTICREVHEESGITVCAQSVEYAASQFWPFPRATILVGYYAAAVEPSAEIVTQDDELEQAIWVGRDWLRSELQKAPNEAAITIPGPSSLANKLIQDWVTNAS